MTRMFTYNGKRMVTWNYFTGCGFNCVYCWARALAETKLKKSYPNGFVPTIHPNRLNKRFKPSDFVFAVSMGDIAFATLEQRRVIANHASQFPCPVLFQTKDPWIFEGSTFDKPNFYLGVTLETNRPYPVTQAPTPYGRYIKIQSGHFKIRFVSIEPIMDFDLPTLVRWVGHIEPEIIEVGADNYHNSLPEPTRGKVNALLNCLRQICPHVIEKDGLERLL